MTFAMSQWCTQDCVWMGSELRRLEDRVVFLEKALEKSTKDKHEICLENDRLREEIDRLKGQNARDSRPEIP